MHYESDILKKIPGIVHGFGTKSDPVAPPVLKLWAPDKPTWQQTHGTELVDVIKKNQICGEVDGLYTRTKNPIGVVSADCVPILLARNDGGMVAALHSGWRGTKAKFVEKFVQKIRSLGEDPANWVAAIGPSIQACCYEVSEELIADFAKTFPEIDHNILSPEHRKLDLQAINGLELERMGIGDIDLVDECTYCAHAKGVPTFHSFRREGSGTRQWSVIVRV